MNNYKIKGIWATFRWVEDPMGVNFELRVCRNKEGRGEGKELLDPTDT